MDYAEFLEQKQQGISYHGFDLDRTAIHSKLYPFQREVVLWALKLGKSALFQECGLGKTIQQLEWAKHVADHTGGKVLILAPLAVTSQTITEGKGIGVEVQYCKRQEEMIEKIVITNYERLHLFDGDSFHGVVLDESSILKNFTGKTKKAIIETFRSTPFKLACTATPAPNDHLELGNHADFLDVMPSNEMISRWFINDSMSAGSYRLKRHGAGDFWRWLTSWAVCLSKPSDLGPEYDQSGFTLPSLEMLEYKLAASEQAYARANGSGLLFPDDSPSSTGLHKVKRESLADRVAKAREIADTMDNTPLIVWCDTDYEADALKKAFPEAIEVRGSQTIDEKEKRLTAFSDGKERIIITKPDIAGFGLNWQHCHNQIFTGVSFSLEKTYQAIRRSYRYGQTNPVNVHLIYSETESNIIQVVNRKLNDFKEMQTNMTKAMSEHGLFRNTKRLSLTDAESELAQGENWTVVLGDCVTESRKLEDNSIDFCVHSPPFSNLYIYSSSEADMGNAVNDEEFFTHYDFLIQELYRITRPGRLCAVHCKDLPTYMNRDGAAGLKDFPGRIVRHFEAAGWQYHSRVTIWKDPVIEMQRTKNHGLLHKNFVDRSEACRQGMPDYLVVFRKWPIDGGIEVKHRRTVGDYIGTDPPPATDFQEGGRRSIDDNYSIAVWQRYASPVWFDINQTNVLNTGLARANEDEKHICPLQLDVIARCIDLWTNPGDLVYSPFTGIGSEGYQAIKQGRKFLGAELKREYFQVACRYLREAEFEASKPSLFSLSSGFAGELVGADDAEV